MIRIRYSDLPPGLHARAEAEGRDTVIYLRPGLPAADRRAALLRLRRSGAMGYGPRLPAAAVAAAMALDRALTFSRHCAGAVRAHPYLVLPPTIIAVTTGLAALAAVTTIAMRPPGGGPAGPGPGSSIGVVAPAPASSGRPGRSAGAGRSARPQPGRGTSDSGRASRSALPSRSPGPTSSASPSPSPSPSPSSSGPASPSPSPPASSPAPEPSGSSSAEPSPSPTASGPCLDIGPLGICLG